MDIERLKKQFDFILEIDKEKEIYRQTHITGYKRNENDSEHAWHMAIMTFLLAEYSNEPIDVLHTIKMLLIHDLVEIDAGDTYAYDENGKKTQKQREEKAAKRIYGLLPVDQGNELMNIWKEFEEGKTCEARFARTMDNLQPMMLNAYNGGKDWVCHDVNIDQILKRNERTHLGSEDLWEYAKENFLKPNIEAGKIKTEDK